MRIRVGHLYPDYLNIYADRGNIAVLRRRAGLRGHELDISALGMGDDVDPDAFDLLYVGGGQDREQALIAPTSCSAWATVAATARSCPAQGCFPTRPLQESAA